MDNFIEEWERILTPKEDLLNEAVTLYAIEFGDNSVYVGISRNPEARHIQHQKKSCNSEVRKRIGKIHYRFVIDQTITLKEELSKENILMEKYKSKGFLVLNKRSGGGLGNQVKYLQ